MIPFSLSLEGFLSYKEPVEIDFSGFDLACISGENGAGKSSILDAFTWALFGRARKHDESLINLESDRAAVSLVFNYEGNQYKITRVNPRGGTKQVEFFIRDETSSTWQPLTERTMRDTDNKIVEVLRLDYESFINASFLLQGEADQFTQQNPAARKRILSQILGLEVWEEYRKKAFQKRRETETDISRLDGRLAEIISELSEEDERRSQLQALDSELTQAHDSRKTAEEKLSELQVVISSLEEKGAQLAVDEARVASQEELIAQLEEKIAERGAEKENFQAVLKDAEQINQAYQAWQDAQQSLSEWEQIAERFRESELKRQEPLLRIAAEKARLLQEQTSLETRHQEILAEKRILPGLVEDLKGKQSEIKAAEDQLALRDRIKGQLESAHQAQASAKAENPLLFQEMKELEKRIQELESAEGAHCPLCGQELVEKDRRSLVKRLQKQGKEKGDTYRQNQLTLKDADQVVHDLQLHITQLSLAEKSLRTLSQEADRIENQIAYLEKLDADWQENSQGRLEGIRRQLEKDQYAEDSRKLLEALNKESKDIGYDAGEHDRVRDLANQGSFVQAEKSALEKAEGALGPLEREIKELTDRLSLEKEELSRATAEVEEKRRDYQASRENAPDTTEARAAVLDLTEKEKILERQVGAAQQKVAVLEKQKERKGELDKERLEKSHLVSQLKQLEAAFGKDGVPALLIEQALPNIEARANLILDKLSGGNMSIRFITQREYKDRGREDLKETLEIQIRDQAGYRDYEMYSGGESFRINFAIRLALSHLLAQRAGARLQTLVIDEGFGSQDAVGRQRLIEAINLIKDDFEKILVITHVEQIKEAFSTQLLVEKTSHGSQVTLV
jgi:exonuclease SbcC